jgi:hypothetical protein
VCLCVLQIDKKPLKVDISFNVGSGVVNSDRIL